MEHSDNFSPEVSREHIYVRDLRRPVLDLITPAYILDAESNFQDWNVAFDELVARPLQLRLGMSSSLFADLETRSRNALVECQTFEYKHPRFGRMVLQKTSSNLVDEKGMRKARVVHLNALKAEHLDLYWADITRRIEADILWSAYGMGVDNLWVTHKDYQEALGRLMQVARRGHAVLELGCGTGNLTLRLLKGKMPRQIWVNESVQTLLEKARRKFAEHYYLVEGENLPTLNVRKSVLDRLEDFEDEKWDAVISFDGFHRMNSLKRGLRELSRVLKTKGELAFLAWHRQSSADEFLKQLRDHLESIGRLPDADTVYQSFAQTLRKLVPVLTKIERTELPALLERAGFGNVQIQDDLHSGHLLFVTATKN